MSRVILAMVAWAVILTACAFWFVIWPVVGLLYMFGYL